VTTAVRAASKEICAIVLRLPFAFHKDKGAQQSLFWGRPAGFGAGNTGVAQVEVKK